MADLPSNEERHGGSMTVRRPRVSAPLDLDAIPAWSEKDTRCCVCLLPFPTSAQISYHAERECDPSPCWCEELCWVNEGGECYPSDEDDLDIEEMFLALRGWQEATRRLRAENQALRASLRGECSAHHSDEASDTPCAVGQRYAYRIEEGPDA